MFGRFQIRRIHHRTEGGCVSFLTKGACERRCLRHSVCHNLAISLHAVHPCIVLRCTVPEQLHTCLRCGVKSASSTLCCTTQTCTHTSCHASRIPHHAYSCSCSCRIGCDRHDRPLLTSGVLAAGNRASYMGPLVHPSVHRPGDLQPGERPCSFQVWAVDV